MTDLAVAKTILAQLGGDRFVAMTGATLMGSADKLTIKLPGRSSGGCVNCVVVTLTAMDDYQVEGLNIRGLNVRPVAFKEGIYDTGLRAAFEGMTGLATSL